jgi:hypothetical protein
MVLGIGGAVVGSVGLAIGLSGFKNLFSPEGPDYGSSQMNTGSVLMITGGAMLLTAIPFSIAGKRNTRKAKLMLSTASLSPLSTNKLFSAGVAINF